MRKLVAGLGLGALLVAGCHWPWMKEPTPPPAPAVSKQDLPKAEALVAYLNQNANRIKGMQARVDIDALQGNQGIGLTGLVAASEPPNFRLKANVLGKAAVDLGSNDQEFWYW